jgi:hypothetical protein
MRTRRKPLGWRLRLGITVGVMFVLSIFYYFGRMDLARPVIFSGGMIWFAVAIRWRLRKFWWFWAAIATVVGVHIYLILRIQWDEEYLPWIVILPFALADFGLVIGFFKLIEIVSLDREQLEETPRRNLTP